MPWLFAYGTLRQPAVQLSTFGQHAIVRFNGRPDSRVRGMVFEVTDAELAKADRYEPAGYTRVTATLASGTQAWVFAAQIRQS